MSWLFPLNGAFAILIWGARIVVLAALVDAFVRPEGAYVASGKQTKWFWLLVLVLGFFLSLVGVIAGIVYFVDVRPALKDSGGGGRGGGSSSDGPYGPYRG